MTNAEFETKLSLIKSKNVHKQQKAYLRQKKKNGKPHKPRMETSKKVAIYLFCLFNVILIYAMVVMLILGDLSCLSVLITDIAAQVLTYTVYCMKAYHGKKQEELIKLEREYLDNSDEMEEEP